MLITAEIQWRSTAPAGVGEFCRFCLIHNRDQGKTLLAAMLCLTLAEVYMIEAILPTAEMAVAIAQKLRVPSAPPKSYEDFKVVLIGEQDICKRI